MKLTKIEKGTDDGSFDWLLAHPLNGLHGDETGHLFRKLIKRHNEMVDYIKELEQKI